MRKYYIIIISTICLLFAISCKKDNSTVIKGNLSNLSNPYILASYISADSVIIDTIAVNEKNQFNYRVNIDSLTTFSLFMNNQESATVIFADIGQKINIKGDALLPDLIN